MLHSSPTPNPGWLQTRLSVQAQGDGPTWPVYRVELRGDDYVVLVDDIEAWRGQSPGQYLTPATDDWNFYPRLATK
jgi:hypothetical protein